MTAQQLRRMWREFHATPSCATSEGNCCVRVCPATGGFLKSSTPALASSSCQISSTYDRFATPLMTGQPRLNAREMSYALICVFGGATKSQLRQLPARTAKLVAPYWSDAGDAADAQAVLE